MHLPRLPIAVAPARPPARHETVASYVTRLAELHGVHPRELSESVSSAVPGSRRRRVHADRLAVLVGRPVQHLRAALPELRDPAPDWAAWRHQPQPRCPRCDARHDGGAVQRLLPQLRYVCTEHRYWIGPPDTGQTATPLGPELDDIVRAQRRHVRLVHRHGPVAAIDAVLTGLLICGHLWDDKLDGWTGVRLRWERRSEHLIPPLSEMRTFSASRLFAAVYPEAVALGELIASPAWRALAGGDAERQRRFLDEIGRRLGRHYYRPHENGDVIAHWMIYDSNQQPSRPAKTYPDTREHGSIRPAQVSPQSRDRHERSAMWFSINRRGGRVILHHRHIRPVLIRDWSTPMDGIAATIWASQSTTLPSSLARKPARMQLSPGRFDAPLEVPEVVRPSSTGSQRPGRSVVRRCSDNL